MIPLVDLAPVNAPLRDLILADIRELSRSGRFVNGPAVERFEEEYAAYCGRRYCVAVSSGLDALRLALKASGLEPGDRVAVPALTFVATVDAVVQAGGTPVLCDVDDDGLMSNWGGLRIKVPVHLHGQMAHVSGDDGLFEDACQAHGLALGAKTAAAAYSFYPAKNLGAWGDAGAIMTDDYPLASGARLLRNHGYGPVLRKTRYHGAVGYTARMDALQALVLSRKLPVLDEWNGQRAEAARRYGEMLDGAGDLRLPVGVKPRVWHVYSIRTADPKGLAAHLAERGIETGHHYDRPIHLPLGPYRILGQPGEFPGAEAYARECLSLPLYPGITEAQQEEVVAGVRGWFDGR